MAVYDDEKTNTEDLHKTTGIGKDEMRDMEARAHAGADQDRAAQNDDLEQSFAGRSADDSDLPPGHPSRSSSPNDTVGQGYNEDSTDKGSRLSRVKGKFTKKRSAALIIVGGVFGGGILGFSLLQGPMQFVQIAQMFQKFHFSPVEDFGDDRGFKTLAYGLLGSAERGRLSALGNKAADAWEENLLKKTGLEPLYSNGTGRLFGYGIVDLDRFESSVADLNDRDHSKLESKLGKGAAIKNASDLPVDVRNKDGKVNGNNKVIQVSDKYRDRRSQTRAIGKLTGNSKIVSTMGSRLLIKRGGIGFHPLGLARKANDKLEEYRTKVKRERTQQIREGSNGKSATKKPTGSSEANEKIEELNTGESEGKDTTKLTKVLSKGMGATAVVAVVCGAKTFGDSVPEYKYTNSVLPMMRLGMNTVVIGNQVMSGQDVNMDELAVYNEYFYDKETKTSWMDAESIRAENGKSGGIAMPKEAGLQHVNDKPLFFDILDGIPGLGVPCGIINTLGDLTPEFVNNAMNAIINAPLGLFNTSTDELTEMALGAVAGKSVNVNASGAEFGNLANTGAFLAANDNAITMGGRALTQAETVALNTESRALEDNTKSIAARYLDPYDINSLFGSIVASSPGSLDQFVDSGIKPLKSAGNILSNIASLLIPGSHASSGSYDYGVPKYGFSLEEQQDERFENPYDNAAIVEPRLDELNDKYGECFSMKINTESSELVIESGEATNVFEIKDKAECKENSEDFLRYRFYLADAIAVSSLACFEANDQQACANVGNETSSGGLEAPEGTLIASAKIDMDHLTDDSSSVACAKNTKDLGIQDGYTQGTKVRIRICAVPNIPSTGEESNGGYGVTGAGGKVVVNSRVSGAFYALAEAAKADKINLGAASSFRTMSHQQTLCSGDSGCSSGTSYGTVAKPGTSNHQLGVAVDFNIPGIGISRSNCINVGGKCTATGYKEWEWLNKNAEKFGLKQYVNEFWHFSPTGS